MNAIDPNRTAPGNSGYGPQSEVQTVSTEKKVKKFKLPEDRLKKDKKVEAAYKAWRGAGEVWGDLASRGNLAKTYDDLCKLLDPLLRSKGWIPEGKYLQFEAYRNAEGQADGIQWWVSDEPKKGFGLQILDPFED